MIPPPGRTFHRRILGVEALPLQLRDGWCVERIVPERDRFLVEAAGETAGFTIEVRPPLELSLLPGSARGPRAALRLGLERVAAALRAGRHRAGPELWRRPVQAVFFLTDACNLRCAYCVVPFGGNTLSEGRVERAFELLAGEAAAFTLLGGEPTLAWEHLVFVVERARASFPASPISMVTNATRIDPERAAWLAELGLEVTVSLDGRRDSHALWRVGAQNRGRERAEELYEQALRGAHLLLERGLRLRANMVVTPETAGRLRENAAWLYGLGFDTLSVSPAVGVRWPDPAVEALSEGLEGYGEELLAGLEEADGERRRRARAALQWELRRAWYFLGEGVFHPYARRVVFGADGRLFSDLYNHEIAGELYLGELDEVAELSEIDDHRTTTPQASYVAAGWSEQVLEDVRTISRVQLARLAGIDAAFERRFPGTPGALELGGHPPFASPTAAGG